jgi:phenylpropionate dioxygenase-like ring-hydroxylating dioxygenase large terminal subunit
MVENLMQQPASDPIEATAPADLPRALPAWVYNHSELHRLELERIFLPSWQIVCHINSIPKSGDYVTFDLGPESVLVLRDRDGAIKAYYNVCRHRGARLLDGAGSCPGPITCPYHGWSYRQDGTLVGVPMREGFPGMDRADFSLKPARVDVAFGFVFVALRGDPPPVATVWGPLIDEFAPYRFEEMVPLGEISYETWDVDWKIAIDNYLESYHVPIGHPGLNRMFTPDYDDQAAVTSVARGVSWLREQESSQWSERMYQRLVGGIATHLPEKLRRGWRFYSALPNLGIDVFPEQMDFFQVLPSGPGKCVVRSALFGLPDARPEMRALRYLGNRINNQVNDEDRWLCQRVQRGLSSSSYEPGPLSVLERWMLEFHHLLRNRIPEIRLPKAPAHFA